MLTETGMSRLLQVLTLSVHFGRSKQLQKESSGRRARVGCCLCHIMLTQLSKTQFSLLPWVELSLTMLVAASSTCWTEVAMGRD